VAAMIRYSGVDDRVAVSALLVAISIAEVKLLSSLWFATK
jgi:hypothetical protein